VNQFEPVLSKLLVLIHFSGAIHFKGLVQVQQNYVVWFDFQFMVPFDSKPCTYLTLGHLLCGELAPICVNCGLPRYISW
jgi:hypothetical protein